MVRLNFEIYSITKEFFDQMPRDITEVTYTSDSLESEKFKLVNGSGNYKVWIDLDGKKYTNKELANILRKLSNFAHNDGSKFHLWFSDGSGVVWSYEDVIDEMEANYQTMVGRKNHVPKRKSCKSTLPNFTAGFRKML